MIIGIDRLSTVVARYLLGTRGLLSPLSIILYWVTLRSRSLTMYGQVLQINATPTLMVNHKTRNTLFCDQSNYSSRILFSHTPIEFGPTRNSAIRSADPETPTVEPNMKWIG